MKEKRKTNFFDIILNIIIVLLTVLLVYWFIKLLFGKTPSLSEFNFALIVMLTGFLIKIYRELGEIRVGIKHSFIKIGEDIGLIKKKLKI